MTRAPSEWRWFDRLGGYVLAALIGAGILASGFSGLLYATWSGKYLVPKGISYEKRTGDDGKPVWVAIFDRETPRGPVYARWRVEMSVRNSAMQCNDRVTWAEPPFYYETKPGNPALNLPPDRVEYVPHEKLWPCLEAERPVDAIYQWWVVTETAGIPLRPVSMHVTLEDEIVSKVQE